MSEQPRVIDDDEGNITVELYSKELRGWSYTNDDQRRQRMLCAHDYVEGWCDGYEHLKRTFEYLRSLHERADVVKLLNEFHAADNTAEARKALLDKLVPLRKPEDSAR